MARQTRPLRRGATIGILGGGQLGRMLSVAASRLGFKSHIYCPDTASPATHVAAYETNASYDDLDAVREFASKCDVVTYEFENIPEFTAKAAETEAPLRPGQRALKIVQDRLVEKKFLRDKARVPVVPFMEVNSTEDLFVAAVKLDLPAILKTRTLGYNGKGQVVVETEDDLKTAFQTLGEVPCILEASMPFKREVSIIAARGANGDFAAYPLSE